MEKKVRANDDARVHPAGRLRRAGLSSPDNGAGLDGADTSWRALQQRRARGSAAVAGGALPTRRTPRVYEPVPVISPQDQKHLAEARYWEEETRKAKFEADQLQLELGEFQAAVREAKTSNKRNRFYDFSAQVNKESVEECIDTISRWARQDAGKPITVRFNSPGGEITYGLALFDFLRSVDLFDAPITTVAQGTAASMGAVLMQAGRRRIVGPQAFFLLHEASSEDRGRKSISERDEEQKWLVRLNDKLLAIMAERSTLSLREIKARAKRVEWWVDADEAVKIGFADEKGYR